MAECVQCRDLGYEWGYLPDDAEHPQRPNLVAALEQRAAAYAAARMAVEEQRRYLRDLVRELVWAGHVSESEAARVAGVTRTTVRSWLGKDKQAKG